MPRLKTLLACAGLSSFTRRAARPSRDIAIEPIRRPLDEGKGERADDWMFEQDSDATLLAGSMDTLSTSLGRLRETLSRLSVHAPIFVEAEPVMPLGAMNFDRDLFDGEPMMAGGGDPVFSSFDAILFDDVRDTVSFGGETTADFLFQQAA